MASLRQNLAIIAVTSLLVASNMASAQVKLQTNPNLLVAYPYFSIKFVPGEHSSKVNHHSANKSQEVRDNFYTLANPSTDSKPFTLSEIAYYEVVSADHGFGLTYMRHNLHKLPL